MEDKISIIIPFYNAEKFLKRCIESILCQTYDNLELIMVDNLSTDNSVIIAKQYLSDDRVKLIECRNKGVCYSRNAGISLATGKWLLFVDADDYIELDMLENMQQSLLRPNSNFIQCIEIGFVDEDEEGRVFRENNNKREKFFEKEEMLSELFCSTVMHYQGYLWNKLLLLDIVKENGITFDTDIYYNEDRLFLLKYFIAISESGQVCYIPQSGYHYVHHNGSAMGKINKEPVDRVITEIKAFERMEFLLRNENRYEKILGKLSIKSVDACFILFKNFKFEETDIEMQYVRKYLKKQKVKGLKMKTKKFLCQHNWLIGLIGQFWIL